MEPLPMKFDHFHTWHGGCPLFVTNNDPFCGHSICSFYQATSRSMAASANGLCTGPEHHKRWSAPCFSLMTGVKSCLLSYEAQQPQKPATEWTSVLSWVKTREWRVSCFLELDFDHPDWSMMIWSIFASVFLEPRNNSIAVANVH